MISSILLELEYDYSQKAIDKFDEYRARLKSWMITAAAGITAVAFSAHSSLIFGAGALMVLSSVCLKCPMLIFRKM